MPRTAEAAENGLDEAVDALVEQLRTGGHRVTTPRRLLLRSLLAAGGHRTVDELTADVQLQAPDVHLSTIYRNVEELERLGMIEHAHLGHGAATYHLASVAHGHLVCQECGTIIEVPDDFFSPLAERARDEFEFAVDPHHFATIGTCARCR